MDTSTYAEETELTKYIWTHYQHLFSRPEQLAAKAVFAEVKANDSSSLAMAKALREKWGAENDAGVIAALSEGADAFRVCVRERLMRECPERIHINRCPACGRILRTPRARQCLWCSHSWHQSDR